MNISFLLITTAFLYSCSAKIPKSPIVKTTEECLNYEPQKVQLEGILYQKSFPGPPNYEDIKKYKSNEMEIEANIGEMIQKIFDLVNNSTDYQKTKSQIETIAHQLRGAPRPDLTKKSKNEENPQR